MKKNFGKMLLLAQIGIALLFTPNNAVQAANPAAAQQVANANANDARSIDDKLMAAVKHGRQFAVRELLGQGANANQIDPAGNSLLMIAAERGYCGVVQELLRSGANVAYRSFDGRDALMCAAENGNAVTTKYLIEAIKREHRWGILERKDVMGRTALMMAAINGHVEVVSIMLDSLEDRSFKGVKDDYGNTALMLAAEKGRTRVVEVFCNYIAESINFTNMRHQAAFDLAPGGECKEVIRAFKADYDNWYRDPQKVDVFKPSIPMN